MEQLAPYNPFIGQHLKTHAGETTVDRAYIAHYVIPAASATAAGAANVLAATALTTTTKIVTTGITQPPTPRVLSATGSDAGMTGNVVIDGTDAAGVAITDTIAISGTSTVSGDVAFATVTKITLPAYTTADTETISVGLAGAFGLPYKLPYDTVLKIYRDGTATTSTTGTSFSATVLSSNYIVPTSALNAKQIDVYMIV